MNTKQALRAILALINLISDHKLRKLIRAALGLLTDAITTQAERLEDLGNDYRSVLAKLENEKREHEDHHKLEEKERERTRHLELEISRLMDERSKLQAQIVNLRAEILQFNTETHRKARLQLTDPGRGNMIAAIKELRSLVPTGRPEPALCGMGLSEAKDKACAARDGDGTTTVILVKGAPPISTSMWREVA